MKLRHQLQDDGRVIINMVNGTTQTVHVSIREAVRFAWGILSDLDPEGYHRETELTKAAVGKIKKVSQSIQILTLLAEEEMFTPDIGMRIGVSRNQAAVILNRLRDLDLTRAAYVGRIIATGRTPNLWAITGVGREYLKAFSTDPLGRWGRRPAGHEGRPAE